jgi:hypothetical protein
MTQQSKIQIPPPVVLDPAEKFSVLDEMWANVVMPAYQQICLEVFNRTEGKVEIFNNWKKNTDFKMQQELEKAKIDGFLPLVILVDLPY